MSYLYTASLVPIGRPVTMPNDQGQPFTYLYTENSFDAQRTSPRNIKLCVNHDRDMPVGRVELLLTHRDWWRCTFTLDHDIDELRPGQPVSVGLAVMPSGNPILKEVSLVKSGRVAGAEITHCDKLKPVTPRPRVAAPPATRAPVIRRNVPTAPRITPDDELDEYLRRVEWYGNDVPAEVIIEHMKTELAKFRGRRW